MTDLVDQMFPPIHRKWAPEFTDVNFWRPLVGEYDLPEDPAPPSPALSARSDASGQTRLSRLRNFSLLSGSAPLPAAISVSAVSRISATTPNGHSRHTSASSSLASESILEENQRRRRREGQRRLSSASIPGTLEGFHPDDDEDDEDGDGDEEDEGGEDEVEDEEDEEDEEEEEDEYEDKDEEDEYDELLATGEMDKVPFL